jgi:hypothetical protein
MDMMVVEEVIRMTTTPLELAQQYSEGEISRSQLLEVLAVFPYAPRERIAPPFDDPVMTTPGSFEEIGSALACDFIDDELYDEIADAVREHNGGRLP